MRTRIRSALAVVAALALSVTGLTVSAQADSHDSFVLDPATMPVGNVTTDTEVGAFTVRATESSHVVVAAHSRTGVGGYDFTHRLQLQGAGNAEARSVHFSVDDASSVLVHALSGGSDDRTLNLVRGGAGAGTVVDEVTAFSVASDADIPRGVAIAPEAGDYYLTSAGSGINLYRIEVLEGELPQRADWDDVADPVITDIAADSGELVVSFDGVIGNDGGDLATATLTDSGGSVVAEGLTATEGASGQIALAPPSSGTYTAQVSLERAGEAPKASEPVETPAFVLPLGTAQIHTVLITAIDGGLATVRIEWAPVAEAESYNVAIRAAGDTDFTEVTAGLTEPEGEITELTPGATYELQVTTVRGTDSTVSAPYEFTVAGAVERWLTTHAGVGSGGQTIVHDDGSVTFDAIGNNGKIADSEDGFWYYYTQVDPSTENVTLTATFTIDDASGKDNQSGFGLIAVDDFIPGNPAARYFNSAGTMAAKYNQVTDGVTQSRYGISGGKFVRGYSDAPTMPSADRDMSASVPHQWDFRPGYTEGTNVNPPKFITGDVYEYTLRFSNTGFHSSARFLGNPETGEGPQEAWEEVIYYGRDLVLTQSQDSFYVGLFGTRGIQVTASDIEFSTIHPDDDEPPLDRPTEYITPSLRVDGTRTTPHQELQVPLLANVYGEVVIVDAEGQAVTPVASLAPGEPAAVSLDLQPGENAFVAQFTPSASQPQLEEYEELSSYDRLDVTFGITVHSYGQPGQAIHVAPDGSPEGSGAPADPLDLHTAAAFVQPGQQIVLTDGTYTLQRALVIERGNNGTADAPITLMSAPGTRAVLDLVDSPSGGIQLRGDHWHLYNLELTRSQGYQKPLLISGHHNVIERIESHHNQDTGIQISGNSNEPPSMWPSHNLVVSSVSHNNADPLANDADGFAAKLTVGEGNVFRYNIAYHNIDDGWDLYARSTTGPIGVVLIEDSVTFNNGWLEDDPGMALVGEGNGFKLGGESTPGRHVLRNSISYNNLAKGVTSNSGPDVRLFDITSYGNGIPGGSQYGRMNVQLTSNALETDFEASGVLSYVAQQTDDIVLREQDTSLLSDPSNFFDGQSNGVTVSEDWFVSLDVEQIRPQIADDGSIDMGGLLELTDAAPSDTGARFGPNPNPTQLTLLPPVSEPDDEEPHAPWDPSTIYLGGETVSYDGGIYVAQWWTQNQAPGDPWGPWAQLGQVVVCGDEEVRTWTPSWIYTGGELVAHDGTVWRAQWWTRNQQPGDPYGPWSALRACT